MNAKDLAEIARISGGHFWRALDRDALVNAYRSIDRLERTKISTHVHWETLERFRLFAELALALTLAAWILETTWLRRNP
jgi:Ca-activated chloride channel family protein